MWIARFGIMRRIAVNIDQLCCETITIFYDDTACKRRVVCQTTERRAFRRIFQHFNFTYWFQHSSRKDSLIFKVGESRVACRVWKACNKSLRDTLNAMIADWLRVTKYVPPSARFQVFPLSEALKACFSQVVCQLMNSMETQSDSF